MKRLIVITCVLFACEVVFGQKMQFLTDVHDFGEIKETEGKVEYEFPFVNKVKGAYIELVKSPYRHIRVEYSRDILKKKDKGVVKLIYDPAGKSGVFSNAVTVTVNEKGKKYTKELTLKGYVEPRPRTPQ